MTAGGTRSRRPTGYSWANPLHVAACGFGSGLLPYAPGTFGTGVGVLFYLALSPLAWPWYLAAVALLVAVGIRICGRSAADFGVHDHGAIVWDEVVGYLVTMVGVAPAAGSAALGFVLFRVFDIAKPWPIRAVDRRVGGGLGIVLDDLLAGVYAALVLHALLFLGMR